MNSGQMNFRVLLIVSLCSLIGLDSSPQVFRGSVHDASNYRALSYTSSGIIHRGIGGISNEDGSFEIEQGAASPSGTLKISYIGYDSKILVGAIDFSQNHLIRLIPSATQLPKVEIVADRQPGKFGNHCKKPRGSQVGVITNQRRVLPGEQSSSSMILRFYLED